MKLRTKLLNPYCLFYDQLGREKTRQLIGTEAIGECIRITYSFSSAQGPVYIKHIRIPL